MLFLAVFCGFLAEYQLEHQIEKDREKQFIQSFIEDLETDTAAINKKRIPTEINNLWKYMLIHIQQEKNGHIIYGSS